MTTLAVKYNQSYYLRFRAKYYSKFKAIWTRHYETEMVNGFSRDYALAAQMKYFFNIFYSIKRKMSLDHTYTWENVLADYDIPTISKKLICNGLKLSDMVTVFEINTHIYSFGGLLTFNGIQEYEDYINGTRDDYEVFMFKEGANNRLQLYTE